MSEIEPAELGKTLLETQKLDTEIQGLNREVEGLAEEHHLSDLLEQLKEAREAQKAAEGGIVDLEQRQHKLDGELDLLSSKIKKEEEKLFSGSVMNPKELSAIQAEILSLRKRSDEMETEDLEMMEAIDRGLAEVDSSEKNARDVAAEERKARDLYARDLADKEHRVRELEARRDAFKRELDEETVAIYEKLLRDKGGLAVAMIDKGKNCGGCHIEFTRTQIDRFQHNEGIFRCEYCRRILVK